MLAYTRRADLEIEKEIYSAIRRKCEKADDASGVFLMPMLRRDIIHRLQDIWLLAWHTRVAIVAQVATALTRHAMANIDYCSISNGNLSKYKRYIAARRTSSAMRFLREHISSYC